MLSSSILSVSNLWHLLSGINKTYNTLKMAISWRKKNRVTLGLQKNETASFYSNDSIPREDTYQLRKT